MPYLVDGHNLIPHIPGLSLADLEDERALIELLKAFATRKGTKVEVYFDQAPPSLAGSQSFGRLQAYFIRQGTTADEAIIARLNRLGSEARNWTVVTSDRVILAEARSAHSKFVSSPDFAALLKGKTDAAGGGSDKGEDPQISQSEVDFWMERFKGK